MSDYDEIPIAEGVNASPPENVVEALNDEPSENIDALAGRWAELAAEHNAAVAAEEAAEAAEGAEDENDYSPLGELLDAIAAYRFAEEQGASLLIRRAQERLDAAVAAVKGAESA